MGRIYETAGYFSIQIGLDDFDSKLFIFNILHDRRKITVDTSLRLAKYFGVSDSYFLSIQNDIDLRNAKLNLKDEINSIKTYKYV